MTRFALLIPLIALLAGAGPAPDRPVMLPSRDALVAYHLAPATGEPIDIRVAMLAGAKALRFNLPDTSYILVMPSTQTATMVVPLQRTIAPLPWAEGPQSLFLPDEHARYTRRAELTVAGQKCTQWDAQLDQDKRTLCITADGLMLRNQSQDPQGRRNLVEATIVRYEAVPAEIFAMPEGFETITPGPGPAK